MSWSSSWDETHFGKMSGWYINRTYFFDVHPPLGKVRHFFHFLIFLFPAVPVSIRKNGNKSVPSLCAVGK